MLKSQKMSQKNTRPRGRPKKTGSSYRFTVNVTPEAVRVLEKMSRVTLSSLVERAALGYVPETPRSSDTVIISPSKPLSKELARLTVDGRKIMIRMPEKNEAFREVVKLKLGHSWTGGAWTRETPDHLGEMRERVVETAHRIVHAGFILEFPRELLEDVLAANYKPECRRWIIGLQGTRAGWLAFDYPRDDDLYDDLKRVKGAEYDGDFKRLCVRPVWIEELEDVADQLGFGFTPKARRMLEAARAARNTVLIADVPPPPKAQPRVPDPAGMDGEIHAALRDDD